MRSDVTAVDINHEPAKARLSSTQSCEHTRGWPRTTPRRAGFSPRPGSARRACTPRRSTARRCVHPRIRRIAPSCPPASTLRATGDRTRLVPTRVSPVHEHSRGGFRVAVINHDPASAPILRLSRLSTSCGAATTPRCTPACRPGVQSMCRMGPQTPHAECHPPTAHASD